MRLFVSLLLGALARPVLSQALPPETAATMILAAGRSGPWDTSIMVSNVWGVALPITITTQAHTAPYCPSPPCNVLASATVPPHGTFVLPSMPAPEPGYSSQPQAVFVLWPSSAEGPAVTAHATDAGVSCNRSVALPVDETFTTATLVFPFRRPPNSHLNLIVMKPALPNNVNVHVDAWDQDGTRVATTTYPMAASQTSLMVVNLLHQLGLDGLETGSLHVTPGLTVFPTSIAAVGMVVAEDGVQAIRGTQIVDPIRP